MPDAVISKSLHARNNVMVEVFRIPFRAVDTAYIFVKDGYEEELRNQESADRPSNRIQEEVIREYGYKLRLFLQPVNKVLLIRSLFISRPTVMIPTNP